MRIVHFCAGLDGWNGMANTARQFVAEELRAGHDSRLTNDVRELVGSIDVVHLHGAWLPVLWTAARRAKRLGAKLVIRPAGSYDPVRRRFSGWKKWLVAPWEHRMLDRADVVEATCPEEAEWIRAYHPRARVELTDLRRFFDLAKPVSGPPFRTPVRVLYLGRRHPLKGVEFLERAVGEIEQSNDQSNRTIDLRIVSNVFGEELEKIWAWCDVLCLPTLSENFGRVVAEALEHGKHVVVTDGAPVWADLTPEQGIYLRGYRDGTDAQRVELLKRGLMRVLGK